MMTDNQKEIVRILIKRGDEILHGSSKETFTANEEANRLLGDIDRYPHAFVLACIMDRQIKAERAWEIPYKISKEIGGFEFSRLKKLSQSDLSRIFTKNSLHRFNKTMAKNFYLAIQKIQNDYQGDALKLWEGSPSSAALVRRFLSFDGVGIKIATMAVNILARDFKVPMGDHIYIDVSPDIQVLRVFKRIGLISKNATNDELIYCARELNLEYPGIFDLSCWEIGRNWCRPRNPTCIDCYLSKYCPKIV